MKRGILITAVFVLLLALPLRASAVELIIRNEEQNVARIALAYKQSDRYLVEGWIRLAPGQVETITLHDVKDDDVYIHVEFVNSAARQFITGILEVDLLVQDTHFRYVLYEMGEAWTPGAPAMRGAPFQNIPEFYKTEKGKLWFNLSGAAG
ncbi:MAG: DUF1036 domain-containing protein [Desulfovibrionaceae bacterium]|nr:DUF1036 domain-containing protein [Desulfovibrionaceae bacterium]